MLLMSLATFHTTVESSGTCKDDDKIVKLPGQPDEAVSFQQYSGWNKEANIIYLESPAGVGFSYSANSSFYTWVNDNITAHDSLMFLQGWLLKFPEYKNTDFFIAGESYAGSFFLSFFLSFIAGNIKLNYIGNPTLEFDTDFNSEGKFFWSHGIISDDTYRLSETTCNTSQLRREAMTGSFSDPCKIVAARISAQVPDIGFDRYDVTSDVCLSDLVPSLEPIFHPFSSLRSSQVAHSSAFKTGESRDLCVQDEMSKYLNRKDVQEAMHAQLIGVKNWTACTHRVKYDERDLENGSIGVVGSLVSSGIRILVYSGDQDSAVPFIGTRVVVNTLAQRMGLNTSVSYKPWLDDDHQIGGWTQVYGKNKSLAYATIRGASHMAPLSSPKRSLKLFATFLSGKQLAT
ncbi:Serine carboxypeptidase-like 45 [Linum perenne]